MKMLFLIIAASYFISTTGFSSSDTIVTVTVEEQVEFERNFIDRLKYFVDHIVNISILDAGLKTRLNNLDTQSESLKAKRSATYSSASVTRREQHKVAAEVAKNLEMAAYQNAEYLEMNIMKQRKNSEETFSAYMNMRSQKIREQEKTIKATLTAQKHTMTEEDYSIAEARDAVTIEAIYKELHTLEEASNRKFQELSRQFEEAIVAVRTELDSKIKAAKEGYTMAIADADAMERKTCEDANEEYKKGIAALEVQVEAAREASKKAKSLKRIRAVQSDNRYEDLERSLDGEYERLNQDNYKAWLSWNNKRIIDEITEKIMGDVDGGKDLATIEALTLMTSDENISFLRESLIAYPPPYGNAGTFAAEVEKSTLAEVTGFFAAMKTRIENLASGKEAESFEDILERADLKK